MTTLTQHDKRLLIPTDTDAFRKHKDLRLVIFSFLNGLKLYHKIALLDKITRVSLPESGLLDQRKVLTMKHMPLNYINLAYAFQLADTIELVASKDTIQTVNLMANVIALKNRLIPKNTTQIDLTLDGLTKEQASSIINNQLDKSITVRKLTNKAGSSGNLQTRFNIDYIFYRECKFIYSVVNIHMVNNQNCYKFVRCSFTINSKPCRDCFPNCLSLKLKHSPDLLQSAKFESMHKLQSLEINQDLEIYPLPNSLGRIPSLALAKINITTENITKTAIEDILEQVNHLSARSTHVTVKSKKFKQIPLKILLNVNNLVEEKIRQNYQCELSEADETTVQIRFNSLISNKKVTIYTQGLES